MCPLLFNVPFIMSSIKRRHSWSLTWYPEQRELCYSFVDPRAIESLRYREVDFADTLGLEYV